MRTEPTTRWEATVSTVVNGIPCLVATSKVYAWGGNEEKQNHLSNGDASLLKNHPHSLIVHKLL